jgi:hypothetical protein
MIDFMHRNGKPPDTSSLLLWNPEETQICDKVLEYAIRTCMRNRAVNLKNADLLRNYCANSIKHTFSEKNTSPKQIQLIEKIFAGANVINKWICGIEADT